MTARDAPGPGRPSPAAVTFDCWNTLLQERNWTVAHGLRVDGLVQAARESGRPVARERAGEAFDAAWHRHMQLWAEGGASGAADVAEWALAALGLDASEEVRARLVYRYETASHSSEVVALPGARETLAALADDGVRLGVVCDTGLTPGRIVRDHLEHHGLLRYLESQIFSDEIGVPKPHPRAFESALEGFGIPPHRSLHVGDLRRTDVAGARACGMASVHIREPHDDESPLPEADFVVDSHIELRALLANGRARS